VVLGIEPLASDILGKCSSIDIKPKTLALDFKRYWFGLGRGKVVFTFNFKPYTSQMCPTSVVPMARMV
jgi:hypothetical protein